MNTNTMELNMDEMEMANGGGIMDGIFKGAMFGMTGGAFVGGISLGFPGATLGTFIGAAGGAVVGGVIAAFTD